MSETSMPVKPSSTIDWKDQKAVADYQAESAAYNLALQSRLNAQTQEETTATNMAKTRHDAMMSIISNFKS